ncbi:hypothetical protein F7725_012664 [Dissostichus mawsoni]|uniref:Uncharacterized protein n=1 Tax=Dissostichus mawsoni TaxID=36200 RepID=A0A7J5YMW4_DISMA|nr:hypothetical protein F7725_012664 [Dissostichus mawsoni]
MSIKTFQPLPLLERWVQENNELVNKWKQVGGGDTLGRDQSQSQTHLRCCSSEFHTLLRKIQGIPPLADHTQLELTVVYNACVCFTAQSQFSEAELLLKQSTERVLQIHSSSTEDDPAASDPHLFWRTVLKSVGNTALAPCNELMSVFERLSTEVWDKGGSPLTILYW